MHSVVKQDIDQKLQFDIDGHSVLFAPRPLKCLAGFTKHPIWAFGINESISDSSDTEFFLSICLADFGDLWGPLGLHYVEGSDRLLESVSVRGGTLRAPAMTGHIAVEKLAYEVFCHWYDLMEPNPSVFWDSQLFESSGWLLIGVLTSDVESDRHMKFPATSTLVEACICYPKYAESYPNFQLQTKNPSWTLEEKTAQISGGTYINMLYGQTWRFNAGWTLKDVILED
jgi:hypothetical protein